MPTPPYSQVLASWWDAGSLALANGAPVPLWPDRSGVGNDLSQGTALNQPTFNSNFLNGLGGVVFDKTKPSWMGMVAALPSPIMSVFLVCQLNAADQSFLGWTGGGSNNYQVRFHSEASPANASVDVNGQPDVISGSFTTAGTSPLIIGYVFSGNNVTFWDSWRSVSGGGSMGAPMVGLNGVGGLIGRNDLFVTGTIGEILVYQAAFTAYDVNVIASYLAAKWGLTSPPPPTPGYSYLRTQNSIHTQFVSIIPVPLLRKFQLKLIDIGYNLRHYQLRR